MRCWLCGKKIKLCQSQRLCLACGLIVTVCADDRNCYPFKERKDKYVCKSKDQKR